MNNLHIILMCKIRLSLWYASNVFLKNIIYMENQDTEISNKNNASEIVDTLNKVIYDVHLLMEKIKI